MIDVDDPLTALLNFIRPAFHADAACREHPELSWFPERGEPTKAQLAVCAGCLVRDECREAGADEQVGIWGGLSGNARRRIGGGGGPHVGPTRATAERLEAIARMRARGAASAEIADRLGMSLGALNSLERRYRSDDAA